MNVSFRLDRLRRCFTGIFLMAALSLTMGSIQAANASVKPTVFSLTSISPNSATAGGPGFTMTVIGSGFLQGATVEFGISTMATKFVSADKLTASIPASYFTGPGTVNVTVANPDSSVSNGQTFTVTSPAGPAVLSSLRPSTITSGGPTFTLFLYGSNFAQGAVVYYGTTPLNTQFISATHITAVVKAAYTTGFGIVDVTVVNPVSAASNSQPVNEVPPAGAAKLTSIAPVQAPAGSAKFNLKLIGTNFASGAIAYFGSTALNTQFVSSTRLNAAVSASDIATAGTFAVTVVNTASPASNAVNFTVTVTDFTLTLGTITHDSIAHTYTVPFTLTNSGHNTAPSVTITTARLNSTTTSTSLPFSLGDLAAGANVNSSVDFPDTAGDTGTTETFFVGGTYTGGTFLKEVQVVLPILPPANAGEGN